MEKLLKVEEAAKVIAVSRSTMYQLIKDRALPVVRFGPQTIRIRPEDLLAYVDALPRTGGPEEIVNG